MKNVLLSAAYWLKQRLSKEENQSLGTEEFNSAKIRASFQHKIYIVNFRAESLE
jgi:hypothetical protein